MPAPRRNRGTQSPRSRRPEPPTRNGGGARGGIQQQQPTGKKKKGKKKGKIKSTWRSDMVALNPPFDPRQRAVGDPTHAGSRMKRGWVQTEEDNLRVDFLYNPSSISVSHQTSDATLTPDQQAEADQMTALYPTIGSGTSVTLLYDRTYELHGGSVNGSKGFANRFGVYADVAAWYVLLGMLEEMPTNWENSIITRQPRPSKAYLFIGAKQIYYGWITSLEITYSHWTINMIPARCAITFGFEMLPYDSANRPLRGKIGGNYSDLVADVPNSLTGMATGDQFAGVSTEGTFEGDEGVPNYSGHYPQSGYGGGPQ